MSKEEKGFAFLAPLVIIIVLVILGISAYFTFQKAKEFSSQQNNQAQTPAVSQEQNTIQNQQTVCTQEAKQCPDGSFVSRTGPNCDFAECPVD